MFFPLCLDLFQQFFRRFRWVSRPPLEDAPFFGQLAFRGNMTLNPSSV
jgi:hypothetical protein